ncbi:UNVERIFIED_CONTAM: hypothetical protein GTU68_006091 [Idotea baltica]|nr:hypothetical protein [Idotea baltica]
MRAVVFICCLVVFSCHLSSGQLFEESTIEGSGDSSTSASSLYCSDEVSDQCPTTDGDFPVYIANPDDCQSFCECSAGLAYSFTCQDGTLWDEEYNVCNFPEYVDCGDRPSPNDRVFTFNLVPTNHCIIMRMIKATFLAKK